MSTDIKTILDDPSRNLEYEALLKKKHESDVVLVDVRENSEIQETGQLPDSIHIPLGELEAALKNLSDEEFLLRYKAAKPSKNSQLIFSCKSGNRSRKAFEIALRLGYGKAGHYKGGWTDWEKNTKKA